MEVLTAILSCFTDNETKIHSERMTIKAIELVRDGARVITVLSGSN